MSNYSQNLENRERRARRNLARVGMALNKTPSRSRLREYFGAGYMVVEGNTIRSGCGSRAYQDTIDDVEMFIASRQATPNG